MATWDDFKKAIKVFEGNIPYMYLDSKGNVTVGVGNMLPNVASATSLSFVDRKTNRLATKEAIQADFAAVKARPKNLDAIDYKPFTKLDLPQAVIDSKLNSQIASFKGELVSNFPDFSTYPVPAQMALTDMAFNMGTERFLRKFPGLKKAVEAEDWAKAATESHRVDVQDSRNDLINSWFSEGVKAKK